MFFELHSGGERAVLVQIAIDGGANEPDLGEFIELVRSAGGDPADCRERAATAYNDCARRCNAGNDDDGGDGEGDDDDMIREDNQINLNGMPFKD